VRICWAGRRAFQSADAELLDAVTGRTVRRFRWESTEQAVSRAGLPAGTYVVRGGGTAVRVVFAD
jgi:hypothetical protein